MKRQIVFIVLMLFSIVSIHAANPTEMQRKAKTEIYKSLKSKSYITNITDKGDETIEFMMEEVQYYVSINQLNTNTLYLCLSVGYGLPNEYNSEIANIAAFNAASGKPVCSAAFNGVLMFSCEMYAKDSKPFISVLPNMLDALYTSVQSFQNEYDKAEQMYIPSSLSSSIAMHSNEKEFIYPKVLSKGDSKVYIKKVTLEPNYTILDMVSYNGGQYQWCSISKNSYISVNGTRYPMSRTEGIECSPQHTDYPGWDSGREVALHFKLYFPTLPKGTTSFDFSEGSVDGWNLKGVELKHGNAYAINGEHIETAYHKWDCTAIEVQNVQTIVTKTVQPKSEGTFIYSSQDEYIEDAETGRKYYLQNSSIGFEGSPVISHDTETITFYEVYPALPSSVKKINISSGSQYYVKNLKIR